MCMASAMWPVGLGGNWIYLVRYCGIPNVTTAVGTFWRPEWKIPHFLQARNLPPSLSFSQNSHSRADSCIRFVLSLCYAQRTRVQRSYCHFWSSKSSWHLRNGQQVRYAWYINFSLMAYKVNCPEPTVTLDIPVNDIQNTTELPIDTNLISEAEVSRAIRQLNKTA